jgi:hypothetical protein
MRSFIYASTAKSVVTERQGRAGVVGMNLRHIEDPALPRFDGGPAFEQPRCRLDISSRCLPAARLSSCRAMRMGASKRHARWCAVHSGGASGSATGA